MWDWLSITGRDGGGGGAALYNGRGGGASEILSLQKGGVFFSHPEMGDTKSFGVVLTWVFEILTILVGEHKRFPLLKRGV